MAHWTHKESGCSGWDLTSAISWRPYDCRRHIRSIIKRFSRVVRSLTRQSYRLKVLHLLKTEIATFQRIIIRQTVRMMPGLYWHRSQLPAAGAEVASKDEAGSIVRLGGNFEESAEWACKPSENAVFVMVCMLKYLRLSCKESSDWDGVFFPLSDQASKNRNCLHRVNVLPRSSPLPLP